MPHDMEAHPIADTAPCMKPECAAAARSSSSTLLNRTLEDARHKQDVPRARKLRAWLARLDHAGGDSLD